MKRISAYLFYESCVDQRVFIVFFVIVAAVQYAIMWA